MWNKEVERKVKRGSTSAVEKGSLVRANKKTSYTVRPEVQHALEADLGRSRKNEEEAGVTRAAEGKTSKVDRRGALIHAGEGRR